jgi:hypothetical protein
MSELARRLDAIHEKLVAERPSASLELFQAGLKPLIGFLMREFSGLSYDDAYDHAVDTIIKHTERPGAFDRSKSSLWTFLCLMAARDVQDARRSRVKRRVLEEKNAFDLELWGVQANNGYDAVEIGRDAETIMRLHGDTIATDEIERKVLDLMLAGEREVAPYAEAMGLGPGVDTAADVKRAKDRINLRLKKVYDEL